MHSRPAAVRAAIFGAVGIPAVLLSTVSAPAAGYVPGAYHVSAPSGAFASVLMSVTVNAYVHDLITRLGKDGLKLAVPAGAFHHPTQVSILGGNAKQLASHLPHGDRLVNDVAVGWIPSTRAQKNLTLRFTAPGSMHGMKVFRTTAHGLALFTAARVKGKHLTLWFSRPSGFVLAKAKTRH